MFHFSAVTTDCLQNAGWYPGYVKDISEYETLLTEAGYPLHPAVQDFLSHFGGLKIIYPHPYVEGVWRELCIDCAPQFVTFPGYHSKVAG